MLNRTCLKHANATVRGNGAVLAQKVSERFRVKQFIAIDMHGTVVGASRPISSFTLPLHCPKRLFRVNWFSSKFEKRREALPLYKLERS